MENNEIKNITPITNNNSSNNMETITPINNFQNNIQNQVQTPISNISSQNINDDFTHGLPDWDLVPPYTTVRRVNRK